ncbi:MAG: dihydrofolate reductase family protein [Anaerolineae bacterium]|nr:dihydrofolate reductase family protein [Anaerolineae bacterium]
MGRVIIDITMSVDGFVTGPNDGPGNGLGDGGRILHDWVFKGTDADKPFLMGEGYDIGAGILGRRTFDIANEAWGDNPPMQGTVFVLTHRPHETVQRGAATFVFITDGAEAALALARDEAAGKDIMLMGADVSQQYLHMGEVDFMTLHVANVLLGKGRPLFAHIGNDPIKLECVHCVPTPSATHMQYSIVKSI